MAVGGYPYMPDVEIVDMTSEVASNCPKPRDYPRDIYGMVGTFRHERPLVCGGRYQLANGSTYRQEKMATKSLEKIG